MPRIERHSLMSLETYARERPEFRAKAMAHKKDRVVPLGEDVTLFFEDELTVRYQVQEMLLVERIFEEEGIRDELDAYNPLIPDGRNLKATLMVEYTDPEERRKRLQDLIGIEDKIWVRVAAHEHVWAIADEDLDRENEEKTAAVHFLRFELSDDMAHALKKGAALELGIDHPKYAVKVEASPTVRDSLARDLA